MALAPGVRLGEDMVAFLEESSHARSQPDCSDLGDHRFGAAHPEHGSSEPVLWVQNTSHPLIRRDLVSGESILWNHADDSRHRLARWRVDCPRTYSYSAPSHTVPTVHRHIRIASEPGRLAAVCLATLTQTRPLTTAQIRGTAAAGADELTGLSLHRSCQSSLASLGVNE